MKWHWCRLPFLIPAISGISSNRKTYSKVVFRRVAILVEVALMSGSVRNLSFLCPYLQKRWCSCHTSSVLYLYLEWFLVCKWFWCSKLVIFVVYFGSVSISGVVCYWQQPFGSLPSILRNWSTVYCRSALFVIRSPVFHFQKYCTQSTNLLWEYKLIRAVGGFCVERMLFIEFLVISSCVTLVWRRIWGR